MKKLYFLMGAAALTLSACSNDDVVDVAKNQEIGFTTFVDKSTRATDADDLNSTGLQASGFAVWGVTWDDAEGAGSVSTVFQDQEVTYNATDGWTYHPLRYWIADNEYRFSALAPLSAVNNTDIMTVTQKTDYVSYDEAKGGLVITFDNSKAEAKTDLCFAKAKYQNVVANQTPAALTFTHMLSRVKFTFKNCFQSEQSFIRLSNINIEDATSKATIDTYAGEESWTEEAGGGTFIIPFNKIALTGGSTQQIIPGGTNPGLTHQQSTEHQYILPLGTEKQYTANFTVELIIYDHVNTKYTQIGTYTHKVTLPAIKFNQNASYNFIAEINNTNINPDQQMYPIKFTAEVSGWDEFSDESFILPKNVTSE